jgi:alkyldihydroxyacetonephosphate synthase
MSTVSATALHDILAAIVGVEHVLTDDESRERLSFDAVTAHRLGGRSELAEARVEAVARPATTAEVAAVVSLASERGIPVVPYGGGTGVMGAVVPVRGGIALDLRRMDRIVEVSREDRTARVQPGVYLADLDSAAHDHGMMLGHDPWSVPIATVGGAISTDSVGYRASKYGSMGRQARALEVVLGDGEIVRTRPIARQSSGPMLNGLFAGAEGTMGVITEATVQLFAQPEAREFASIGFRSFEQGYPAVVRLFDIGLVPALIDLTEEPGTPENAAPCILYLGFEGYREQVEAQRSRTMAEALAAGGRDLGPGPTREYWEARHAVAERWRDRTRPLRPTERWKEQRWRYADYLHVAMPA